MDSMLIIPPLFGMAGLLVALFIYFVVLRYDGGTDKVKKIADQMQLKLIQELPQLQQIKELKLLYP